MLRSSQPSQSYRQDALLSKLKQFVGHMDSKSHNIQASDKNNPNSLRKPYNSGSTYLQASLNQSFNQRALKNQNYDFQSQIIQLKQNQTQKKHYVRQKDHRTCTNLKQNKENNCSHMQNYDKLNVKNYFPDRYTGYKPQKRKQIPLRILNDTQNMTKDCLQNKMAEHKQTKNVSQSTKKRINQRQMIIESQTYQNTPSKKVQIQTKIPSDDHEFMQRLNLRKQQYLEFKQRRQDNTEKNFANNQENKFSKIKQGFYKITPSKNQDKNKPFFYLKVTPQKEHASNRSIFQSKQYFESSYKQNDYKKAEKTEKLKKITQINEEINDRIRKIVDNFQSYLTHRKT